MIDKADEGAPTVIEFGLMISTLGFEPEGEASKRMAVRGIEGQV